MNDIEQLGSADVPPRRGSWPPWLTVLLIIAVAFLLSRLFLPRGNNQPPTEHAGVGQPLPLLELQPLTGATEGLSLKDLHGKVTLINYWGPWCGYCIQEFPHLEELWDKYRGDPDFQFVSVSSGGPLREDIPQLREQTQQFLTSRSATFPTYVDAEGGSRQILMSIADMDNFGYPTTVLLDRSGIIRAIWVGYVPGSEDEMEQLVSKLLEESGASQNAKTEDKTDESPQK